MSFAATPPDVRKCYALPAEFFELYRAMPVGSVYLTLLSGVDESWLALENPLASRRILFHQINFSGVVHDESDALKR